MAEGNEETIGRAVCDEQKAAYLAQARKLDAEALKFKADAESVLATARTSRALAVKAEAEADDAVIYNEKKRREYMEELSHNKYHHIYHFTHAVSEDTVSSCMKQLDIWRRESGQDAKDTKQPIEIIFSSPGGSIVDGFVLFDYLQMLRRDGHKIMTGTFGMAASMAGILLQAGDVRWMGKEAWVLIHQAAFGAMGKTFEIEDTVLWIKRIQSRILDIFATRAAAKSGKSLKSVRALIKKNWLRKDWWIASDECLRYGFVDEIR